MKKKAKKTPQETVDDLVELTQSLNMPEDALDGELQDAAQMDAELAYDAVKNAVMIDKIEFLVSRGYRPNRIRQIIEEVAGEVQS